MPVPEWAGPFGIPENPKELQQAFWTTLILYGVYTSLYAIEVWRTIPRMAMHHYANPSCNAIIRQAMRQTSFPTIGRGVNLMISAPTVAVVGATASAVAWASTAEHHGAAVPSVDNLGIAMPMTPELYSRGTYSNPAGWDIASWWDSLF